MSDDEKNIPGDLPAVVRRPSIHGWVHDDKHAEADHNEREVLACVRRAIGEIDTAIAKMLPNFQAQANLVAAAEQLEIVMASMADTFKTRRAARRQKAATPADQPKPTEGATS